MIWLTSDTHFCHNKEFVWKERGYNSIDEMNKAIVYNWNQQVKPEDEVYHLGDVMLNDNAAGMEYLKQLNGKIHIIYGNHDTDARKNMYLESENVVSGGFADIIKYKGYSFYLSHYPSITANGEKSMKQSVCNLFGHTHQKENFYGDCSYMYHVGMDSHGCMPVNLDSIIEEIHKHIDN